MFTKKRLELLKELREYFKEEVHPIGVASSEVLIREEKKEEKQKKLVRKINKKEE